MQTTAKLIQIGNSYGIRIPKFLIEQIKLKDTKISLEAKNGALILKPIKN